MSAALLGRGLVLAGIVAGLLAVSLPFAAETRYVDDGTTAAFLIVLLSFTSLLPAEIGRDLVAAAAGSAAFGFFLVIPSIYAFDSLGSLESGAWLGVCTALIPLGALVVFAQKERRRRRRRSTAGPASWSRRPASFSLQSASGSTSAEKDRRTGTRRPRAMPSGCC